MRYRSRSDVRENNGQSWRPMRRGAVLTTLVRQRLTVTSIAEWRELPITKRGERWVQRVIDKS